MRRRLAALLISATVAAIFPLAAAAKPHLVLVSTTTYKQTLGGFPYECQTQVYIETGVKPAPPAPAATDTRCYLLASAVAAKPAPAHTSSPSKSGPPSA